MFQVKLLNPIAKQGLDLFSDNYAMGTDVQNPDAVLVRSFDMHAIDLPDTVRVVGRAGAGVNNIPIEAYSALGIPVLNTPGANANAVKELVVAGMLMASRNLCAAWDDTKHLQADDNAGLQQQVEQSKKRFKGRELPGRVLVVVGLGKVGVRVANVGIALGMRVIGCDPQISLENAWRLSSQVQQAKSLESALKQADFVSLHVPLMDSTKHLINAERLALLHDDAVLVNLARGGIVDETALAGVLDQDKLHAYVTDFPSLDLREHQRVIALPHLGASTQEAEANCAKMVVEQVRAFLELGHISHSVNFPDAQLGAIKNARLVIANQNIPNMVAQISTYLSEHDCNIIDMLNKSRGNMAYTLLDVDPCPNEAIIQAIREIEGVYSVRCLRPVG